MTVVILTPDPGDPSYAGQWPDVLTRHQAALAGAGVQSRSEAWTDHVLSGKALAEAPLVLPLVAWGYHRDHALWTAACAAWARDGVRMLNPPDVLSWNSDKSYLGRLAGRGVPIPLTVWVDAPTQADVDTAFDRFDTDRLVVKPRVSGGAWKTLRLSRGQPLFDAPDGPALIQPYLPSIETEGETSLLFFDRRFSHAVRKTPVPGEFRIQVQFGGRYRSVEPPPEALALAGTVLAGIDEDLLYARIDMARAPDGGWLLMEAELIEPDLYLAQAPDGGAAFALAVARRL
ncbi:transporter [Brevundimonas sp.]|uniref:ATP-grasp domain-containing protein n=1 Tax=Brevundimonas sp. TaxID=1871086 RepID=UPI002E0E9973|nr:transporter [Brevundimonas sp.]